MSLAGFFYPKLFTSIISWSDPGLAMLLLAGFIGLVFFGQNLFHRTWGLRYWRPAVVVWFLVIGFVLAHRCYNDLLFPGRFIKGLRLQDDYVATTDNTLPGYAGHTQTGFRINIVHSRKIAPKNPKTQEKYYIEFDSVQHLWVTTSDYMRLVHLLNEQKLPYPNGNSPAGLK